MKKNKIILMTSLILLIGFFACNDEMMSELSESDQFALDGIRESYNNAFEENEALKASVELSDSAGIKLHDSLYYHFENLFEEHHNNYSHDNAHDDHHHANGMHMSSNSLIGHSRDDGHHDEDHEIMHKLQSDHESIIN
tara:strand:+ start:5458 stop:5874 length:417 start_codon:yes stop_codon:yes gene_type:complete